VKALKAQIRKGGFSNWSIGRAQAYALVAKHYPQNAKFWRELMRENALWAVRDAKFHISMGLTQ
jgi:hypothetical protein